MSDIRRRLNRLQVIAGGRGCPSCAGWDTTMVQIVAAPVMGWDAPAEPTPMPRPERCPSCGRRPPDRTTVVQIVAPDDDDAGIVGE